MRIATISVVTKVGNGLYVIFAFQCHEDCDGITIEEIQRNAKSNIRLPMS